MGGRYSVVGTVFGQLTQATAFSEAGFKEVRTRQGMIAGRRSSDVQAAKSFKPDDIPDRLVNQVFMVVRCCHFCCGVESEFSSMTFALLLEGIGRKQRDRFRHVP